MQDSFAMMKKKMKKRRSQIGSFGSLADVKGNTFSRFVREARSGSAAFAESDSEDEDIPAAKEVKNVHDMRARARSQVRRKNDREQRAAALKRAVTAPAASTIVSEENENEEEDWSNENFKPAFEGEVEKKGHAVKALHRISSASKDWAKLEAEVEGGVEKDLEPEEILPSRERATTHRRGVKSLMRMFGKGGLTGRERRRKEREEMSGRI